MTPTEHCMTCGEPLEYHDRARNVTCAMCGATERAHVTCPNGHYVCEDCHNRDAVEAVRQLLVGSSSADPFELAEDAMALPGIPMLGCHHAFIAGGALATALKNGGSGGFTDASIDEVFERTRRQAQGGYCGLTGVCGITPAVGACVAVLTGSKCGTDREQRLVMEATTRVSRAITELTGPSCCKAYVRTSLDAAVGFLAEELNVELARGGRAVAAGPGGPESDVRGAAPCLFASRHPHGCREELCPYFDGDGQMPREVEMSDPVSIGSTDPPIELRDVTPVAERTGLAGLVDKALGLGVEKAKLIDTSTVAVADWVALKCKYGCVFYERDAYHPPYAPDPAAMRRVLGGYSKAILVNGPKGKPLTEAVVALEGEAYRMGYYKAFALTALSSGGGAT